MGIAIGGIIVVVLIAIALFFAWRQSGVMRALNYDTRLQPDQRLYFLKQCYRRIFGSVLLLVLAGMMIGTLFLDIQPANQMDQQAAKRTLGYLSFYTSGMLLVLLAILVLAIVDFWATTRYSLQQQKRLFQEHHDMLAAELLEHQHRSEPEA